MPGPHPLGGSEPPAYRRGLSAALNIADQVRHDLLDRPLPPPDLQDQPIHRLIQHSRPLAPDQSRQVAARTALTLSHDDARRLQRIVNLLTTAVGELNLWLANAGREALEIEP